MRRTILILGAAAAMAGGCTNMNGDEGAAMMAAGDMTPETRAPYVAMAASSDLYEIQAGQLAQQKAQRADVRSFGGILVQHHTQTSQQLTAAARSSGMTPPPPTLMPMHREMLDELRAASGAAFDTAFLRQQVTAHEMALNLHRNYAANGDTPALRTVAWAAVPVISGHLEQARQLRR